MDRKNHDDVELLESNRDDIEKVHGPNFGRMVGKKSPPVLGSLWIGTITKPEYSAPKKSLAV